MQGRWKAWLIVKIWTMRYYIAHPSMYFKRIKGRTSRMIDREHDSIDYSKLMVWCGLMIGCGLVWYSIFTNGFFITLMWLMVISAIVGLYLRLSDKI